MYKTGNDHRPVHEVGPGFYLFPSLPITEKQNSETADKRGFRRFGFGSKAAAAPEFSATFDTAQGIASDAKGRADSVGTQADEIREQAYAKGFVEGQKVGVEAQKEKFKEALATLHMAMLELDSAKTELYHDAEKQAVELGLMIAKKIVCREISIDKSAIFRVLKEALKKVSDQREIHIKIHPSDLQLINDAEFDVSSLSKGKGNVILESANAICRGECVIETNFGIIDARIESQLEAVEESLMLALQNSATVS